MPVILKYSKGEYQAKISELEGFYNQLNQHLDRMNKLKSEMYNFWNDERARKAGLVLTGEINSVRSAMDRTLDMINFYKSAVAKFDGSIASIEDVLEYAQFLVGGGGE